MSGHGQNVGTLDAVLRIIVGIIVVMTGPVLAVNLQPDWGATIVPVFFIAGGVLIMTGTFRFDPLYKMGEISTVSSE